MTVSRHVLGFVGVDCLSSSSGTGWDGSQGHPGSRPGSLAMTLWAEVGQNGFLSPATVEL